MMGGSCKCAGVTDDGGALSTFAVSEGREYENSGASRADEPSERHPLNKLRGIGFACAAGKLLLFVERRTP